MAHTQDLRARAEKEANNFNLPRNWREKRQPILGLAIDDPKTLLAEDAVWFDFDNHTLDVSVLDAGSFLPASTHIKEYVRSIPDYSKWRTTSSTLKDRGLNLINDEESPAITVRIPLPGSGEEVQIVKSVLKPQRLTHQDAGELLIQGEGETSNIMRALGVVAHKLADQQPKGDVSSDDPEKRLRTALRLSHFVVEQCMKSANTHASEFMLRNGIPTIYLNALWSHKDVRFFSTDSFGNSGFDVHNYAHVTSPLRRVQDLVNQSNLAAFLDGKKQYPYDQDELEEIASDLNKVYDYSSASFEYGSSARHLSRQFANNKAKSHHIVRAIFEATGSREDRSRLKQTAMSNVEANTSKALGVLHRAIADSHLIERPANAQDNVSSERVIEDRRGNLYPAPSGHGWRQDHEAATILGQICGLELNLSPPANDREDEEMFKKGYRFLHKKSINSNDEPSRMKVFSKLGEDGRVTINLYARGELHQEEAEGETPRDALNKAAAQHLKNIGLLNNMPYPMNQGIATYAPQDALREYQQRTGAQPVEFQIDRGEDRIFTCRASLKSINGEVHEVVGIGLTPNESKRSATAFLLSDLPCGPYPRAVPNKKTPEQTSSNRLIGSIQKIYKRFRRYFNKGLQPSNL